MNCLKVAWCIVAFIIIVQECHIIIMDNGITNLVKILRIQDGSLLLFELQVPPSHASFGKEGLAGSLFTHAQIYWIFFP